ncbi:MAG: hypothetical protein ABSG23_04040 [Terriglobales bacterium]
MKYGMKSRVSTLMAAVMAALSFSACGSGSSGGGTPPPSSANEWAWMNGASIANQPGTYGSLGTAASSNVPGAREQAISWLDASGNFWLFSGNGFDSVGNSGFLNDLWKYSSGQWTWMGGSNVVDQPGAYGPLGTAASSNVPGARNSEVRWIDASGNFWLFGGGGYDSNGTLGRLNDLWKYGAGQWTWMSGSNTVNQPGTYGTQGTAATGNVPGARFHAVSWIDASGDFWLFGGNVNALNSAGEFYLNDLWKYSAGQWTWMSGSSTIDQPGMYGIEGTASVNNVPGAREQAFGWTDASGNFWLFGGNGYDSNGNYGFLNDLWKYSAGQWTWMGGASVVDQPGTYGTQGTAVAGNVPGARNSGVSWIDASGNLWLFGGGGYDASGSLGRLNDLWKYGAGQWTWTSGSNIADEPGTYGTLGTAASSNVPGARFHAAGWIDASGTFWFFGGNANTLNGPGEVYLNDLWKYEP